MDSGISKLKVVYLFFVIALVIAVGILVLQTTSDNLEQAVTETNSSSSNQIYISSKTLTAGSGITSSSIKSYNQSWLDFDGANDYVNIPNSPVQAGANLTSGFSISAWVNPNSAGEGNGGRILDKSDDAFAGNGFAYRLDDNLKVCIQINGGIVRRSAGNSAPLGNWTFVSVTINESQWATHYINGVQNGTGGDLNRTITNITTTEDMRVGSISTATNYVFNGSIDEVRFYNKTLNATEITAIYDSGRFANASLLQEDLAAWYTFNDIEGCSTYDSSGEENNGTISGALWKDDSVLTTLLNGTDYTINITTGNLTLISDYLYNGVAIAWTYTSVFNEAISLDEFIGGLAGFASWMLLFVAVIAVSIILSIILGSFGRRTPSV